MEFSIGYEVINSYKRLSYSPWHAFAEFIDNSTQAYFDNKEILDKAFKKEKVSGLKVTIKYEPKKRGGIIQIIDNSIGMSHDELENAMKVAHPPTNTNGRSRYGMGLKTAACWIGNKWTVRTKKFGETSEHKVTIDVNKIATGNLDIQYNEKKSQPKDKHYTIIEISDHNRKFHGRTLGKIRDWLSSMYREDFRKGLLKLEWRNEILKWNEPETLIARDNSPYRKDFDFKVDGKKIRGWVGILRKGTRSQAGFSIVHSGRIIKGWPEAWRPEKIYGQIGGSNDLVNQRVFGEIHLDNFEVSHTKDDILWLGAQEEEIEKALYEKIKDYIEIAKTAKYRSTEGDERGPNETEVDVAIAEVKEELESPEMTDQVENEDVPDQRTVKRTKDRIVDSVTESLDVTIKAKVGTLTVKVYLTDELSINDPYVLVESTKEAEVLVINNIHIGYNSKLVRVFLIT